MKKINRKIPVFKSRREEARFWDSHDINDYLPVMKDVGVIYGAKIPKDETIVIRIQTKLKRKLDLIAKNQGLSLSTLLRLWFIEKLKAM